MKLLMRLMVSPLVLLRILAAYFIASLGTWLVWVFDSKYDHASAMIATAGMIDFLKKWRE